MTVKLWSLHDAVNLVTTGCEPYCRVDVSGAVFDGEFPMLVIYFLLEYTTYNPDLHAFDG
jgi:hypothetical protein